MYIVGLASPICFHGGYFINNNLKFKILQEELKQEKTIFSYEIEPERALSTVEELQKAIVDAIQDRKGTGITIIDLSKLETANAQSYIICEGRTPTQVSAIADSVREKVQELTGQKPYNYDGYRNSTWIVIDYGSVMVHVFVPDARNFYDIEQLWCDGVINKVADLD